MKKAHSCTSLSNIHSETQKLQRQNANVLRSRSMCCLLSHMIIEFPNSRHMYALRTYFLGCHASLTPKKRLPFDCLTNHSFCSIFENLFRTKFAILNLSNQRSCFISPSHGGTIGDNGHSWRGFSSHLFQIQILSRNMQFGTLSSRRTISSLVCASLICPYHLSKICRAWIAELRRVNN